MPQETSSSTAISATNRPYRHVIPRSTAVETWASRSYSDKPPPCHSEERALPVTWESLSRYIILRRPQTEVRIYCTVYPSDGSRRFTILTPPQTPPSGGNTNVDHGATAHAVLQFLPSPKSPPRSGLGSLRSGWGVEPLPSTPISL